MATGYHEGSRISCAMDYLISEGIDCVKIAYPCKGGVTRPTFFPLKVLDDDENLLDTIYRINRTVLIQEGLEIKVKLMEGKRIKNLNSRFEKLENEEVYDVIELEYLPINYASYLIPLHTSYLQF